MFEVFPVANLCANFFWVDMPIFPRNVCSQSFRAMFVGLGQMF